MSEYTFRAMYLDPNLSYIYKYCPIGNYFFENLQNRHIYFSSPQSFNDLFEVKINPDGNDIEYHDQISKRVDEIRDGITYKVIAGIQAEFRRDFRANSSHSSFDAFQERLNQLGVSCFSEDFKNQVMWGLYAQKNSGVCLCFDFVELIDSLQKENGLDSIDFDKVLYKEDIPVTKAGKNAIEWAENLRERVYTKLVEWKHEMEVRILHSSPEVLKYSAQALRKIYFGAKISSEHKNEIIRILSVPEYTIEYFDMIPNSQNQSLIPIGFIP